ncbi:MAG: hypothetical protein Q9203_006632 [Teloschistes exilis]
MPARLIAEIVESTSEGHERGQHVTASASWSEYNVVDVGKVQMIKRIEGLVGETQYLGSLGLTGLTAWHGIVDVVRAEADDSVVVSGAAGATGSMVVQIAKHVLGCRRVVGIAGGAEKCKWVRSLGADECVDYKSGSFKEELVGATEGFVEVYFDNVGGSMLDLMLTRMKRHGRIAACGAVAEYNKDAGKGEGYGIKNWFEVISNRIEIKGFIIFDFAGQYAETVGKLVEAAKEGKIKMDGENETVVEVGFEGVVETWMKLFQGGNRGKLITKLV